MILGFKKKLVNWLFTKEWFTALVKEKVITEIETMPISYFGLSCGLEDRNIIDRYQAMTYGVERCMENVIETIENL